MSSLSNRFIYSPIEELPDYVIQLLPENYDAIYAGRLLDSETVSANQQGLSNEFEKRTFLTKKNGYITDPYTNVKIPAEAIRYNFEKIFVEEVCLVPYSIISTNVDASSYVKTINYTDFDKEIINIQNYYLPESSSDLSFNADILSPFYTFNEDIVVFANKPNYKIGDKVEYEDILRGNNKIGTILELSFDNFPENENKFPTPLYRISGFTRRIKEKSIRKLIKESDSSEDKQIDPLNWNWVRLKSIQEMKDEFGRDWQTITEYGNRDISKIQAFINLEYFNPILQKVYYTGQPEMLSTVHVNKKMLTETLYFTRRPLVFAQNRASSIEQYEYLSLCSRILTSMDIDLLLNKNAIYTRYSKISFEISEKSGIRTESTEGYDREITYKKWSSNPQNEQYVDISKYLEYPKVSSTGTPRFKTADEIKREIHHKYGFSLSNEEYNKVIKDEYGIIPSLHLNGTFLTTALSPKLMNNLYDKRFIDIDDKSNKITLNMVTERPLVNVGDYIVLFETLKFDLFQDYPNIVPQETIGFHIETVLPINNETNEILLRCELDIKNQKSIMLDLDIYKVISIVKKGYAFVGANYNSKNSDFVVSNENIKIFYNSIQIKLAKLSVEQQMAVKVVLSALDKQISYGQSVSPAQIELINEKVTKIRSILS